MSSPISRHHPHFDNAGEFEQDNLLAGDFPMERTSITLKGGIQYVRGSVLQGLEGADEGKFGLVTDDAKARYILLENLDATAADSVGTAAITGSFNRRRLTLGVGATLEGITATLEPLSIFIRDSVSA